MKTFELFQGFKKIYLIWIILKEFKSLEEKKKEKISIHCGEDICFLPKKHASKINS